MKPTFNPYNTPTLCALALVTLVIATSSAHAAVLYWDGTDTTANADGGSGTWDLTTTNWDTLASGGSNIDWTNFGNTDSANFGGTGGTVTFATNLGATGAYPNSINVTAGNYIFDLNSFSLSSRGSNLTISSGATLVIQNGTYELQTNHNFNVTGSNALTVSAKITGAFNLQKAGAGDVRLSNDTSDFTGKLTGANGGTVSFSSIKNSGVASAAGAGSIVETGYNNTMTYTGAGDSTNRTFAVLGSGNDTLKNNGSGALVWTGVFTNTKLGASTLTLGGSNSLENGFQGALIDSTAGGHILSVSKADAGAWKLSGNSSFTGATSVTAGTLLVGHANALGSTVGSTSVTGVSQLILTDDIAVGAEALTLNSGATASWNGQTGAALRNYSGTNSWAGTIALGQNTSIAANSGSALTVSGAISGGFNLTKADSGTLTLSGANTYTGITTIAAGILQANQVDVAATSGALGNGGNISFTGGTLQYTANSAGTNYSTRIVNSTTAAIKLDTNGQNVTFGSALSSTNTAGLTKEGAGQLELKMGAGQYTGTTTINGGTLKFAGTADLDFLSSSSININNGASLVIYSDFNRTTLSNSKTFTFGNTGGGSIVYDKGNHLWQSSTGKFVTTGGTQNTISTANGGFINPQNTSTVNFDVADGTDAVDLLVSVAIGSGNYTKSGAGTLSITSSSTLGGGAAQPNLTINAGIFDVGGSGRLTTSGSAFGVVNSDILNNGVYRHSSSGAQTLSGIMSGTGALTQNGSGTLTLTNTNTYAGTTTITTGTLQLDGSTHASSAVAIATAGTLTGSGTVNGNATLTGNGIINKASGTLAGTLGVTGGNWNGAGAVTGLVTSSSGAFNIGNGANLTANGGLDVTGGTIAAGNAASTITGSLNYTSASNSTFAGVIAGASKTLTMNNAAAKLILTGANTYTGATNVTAGVLAVNGSLGNTTTTIGTGATLQGSGSIAGSVTVNGGGTLATGNSIESLATGALSLLANSTFAYEINNEVAAGAAGDLTAVTGNLTLDLANAAILTLTELGSDSWTLGEKLTLISYSGSWNGGLFNYGGNTLADDSSFTFSGSTWSFNYNDNLAGDNFTSDLTSGSFVTMTVIPEPNVAALIGGFGVLLILRRRR
jgi:autotransporter-associated beta strand protein